MGFFDKILSVAAPVIGSAFGPVGTAIGSAVGGAFSTQDEQDFASSSAAQANAFTKEQLQNRHQWEVADLRNAGLNPVLSAMKGAPSIGGSAVASTGASVADSTASLTSSAAQSRQVDLASKKLQAEIELLHSNATAAKTQGVKNLAEAKNTGNISNVTQNLGNLASGFHGITSSSAKALDDSYKKRDEIFSKLKKAPADYWWFLKHKLKGN